MVAAPPAAPRNRRNGESGLSILEAVVSVGVLLVLFGAFAVARDREMRWLGETHRETAAERAACARLEALAAGGAAAVPGRRPFDLDPETSRLLPGARGEEDIRESAGLLAVEVRVHWKAAGGETRTSSLATLVPAGIRR